MSLEEIIKDILKTAYIYFIFIELLKGGLYGFIKTSYVGRYAQDFIEEYEDIINTFINYGAKINITILLMSMKFV